MQEPSFRDHVVVEEPVNPSDKGFWVDGFHPGRMAVGRSDVKEIFGAARQCRIGDS